MIEITNLAEVNAQLDAWLAGVTRETEAVATGVAAYALRWLALHSPQYSGDFAANWKVKINGIDASFRENAVGGRGEAPRQQGDIDAVGYAVFNGLPRLASFKLGDTIKLSNSARHTYVGKAPDQVTTVFSGVEAYAWKIEGNKIKFRPENAEQGRVRERFLEFFGAAFTDMTKAKARQFLKEGRVAWT